MTFQYGVIGDPISHSLSPMIHKAWMRDNGIDADYSAMRVPSGELEAHIERLSNGGFRGLNITLPYKEYAFRLSNVLSDTAHRVGAVNTLSYQAPNFWKGDNTDAPGFKHAIEHAADSFGLGFGPASQGSALVIGAGGASRAVAYVLGTEGQQAVFCNRTIERAESLVDIYMSVSEAHDQVIAPVVHDLNNLRGKLNECQLVVHATSLGHEGKSIDWPDGKGRFVYDLSYGKAAEAFLKPARDAGWQTVDGLRMLVAQAAYSFKIWFDIDPSIDEGFERARRIVEAMA
ncbi:MAG: shikimate dehydrogenase [Pseudomonadota bacterium]